MAYLSPIILLSLSNVFMTFAWYGHLRFKAAPLWAAVMVSWLIALAEYWLAVPANRIGIAVYTPSQLKTIQRSSRSSSASASPISGSARPRR